MAPEKDVRFSTHRTSHTASRPAFAAHRLASIQRGSRRKRVSSPDRVDAKSIVFGQTWNDRNHDAYSIALISQGAKFDGPAKDAQLASYIPKQKHPAAPSAYPAPTPITAVAFSPDAKELAVGGFDGSVRIWNLEDGKALLTFIAAPGYLEENQ